MADNDEKLMCPRCEKKKMVYKGIRHVTQSGTEETLARLNPVATGPEPLKMYACKKCGYCEFYMQ